MIFAQPYVFARMMHGTSLTNENITSFSNFTAKDFNT